LARRYEADLLEIACEDGACALEEEIAALGEPGRRIADFGCGPGSLLPLLAKCFGEVIAVDYAPDLLEAARVRCRSRKVVFACHDLSCGTGLATMVDVACCVNALIDPDTEKRSGMVRALVRSLTKKGAAVVVVPALESVFHVYHTLVQIREREGKPAGLSPREADEMMRAEVSSFADGLVRVGGVLTKYWMREELVAFLADHGLRVTKVRRVEYGWKEEIEHVPRWVQGARPWDWLVVAEHRK
jgi:SAM-dependent methyltransferase